MVSFCGLLASAGLSLVLGLAMVLGWCWCFWCISLVLSLKRIIEPPPIELGGVRVLSLVLSLGLIFELPIQMGSWVRS